MTGLSGLGLEGSVSILEHFLFVDLGVLGVEGPLWTKFSDFSRTSSCNLYCPGSSIFGISGDTVYMQDIIISDFLRSMEQLVWNYA